MKDIALKRFRLLIIPINFNKKRVSVLINKAYENLMTRRSVRKFTDKKISREDLELIAQAAIYAPSAMNRQSWQITVIDNRDKIQSLARVIAKQLDRDEGYCFYAPDALIITSNQRDNRNGVEDCACALENIFLSAHSLGIGSVWINQLKGICDEPEIRAELDKLSIPADHLVWGMAALGYAAEEPKKADKNTGVIKWID